MIKGLDHTGIEVPELEPVREFYEKVLGLRPVLDKELPPGGWARRLLFLEGEGFTVEFLHCPGVEVTRNFHLSFEVDSISRVVNALKSAGVQQIEPVRPALPRLDGRQRFRTFFSGPVGERLEFMGPE